MRARTALPLLVVTVLCAAGPRDAVAQTTPYAGGGASFPTGEFGEYADTGWQVAGGVLFPISDTGLAVGGEAFHSSNERKPDATGITYNLALGLVAVLRYGFATFGSVTPYVSGGAGLHYLSTRGGDGSVDIPFGYQLGAGLSFRLAANTAVFVEGRYTADSMLGYYGLIGGLSFPLGDD